MSDNSHILYAVPVNIIITNHIHYTSFELTLFSEHLSKRNWSRVFQNSKKCINVLKLPDNYKNRPFKQ
jgi:hypothetical protein